VTQENSGTVSSQPLIENELESFWKNTDSLVTTYPLTLMTVEAAKRGAELELASFIESKCANVTRDGSTIRGDVPHDRVHEYSAVKRKLDRGSIASKVIPRSYLVSLVSQYDSFLGGLLRALFFMQPELLNASDRVLTFKDLASFSSLESAREHMVEKEIETLLRKSHAEQFDWLEHRFSVELRKGLAAWPKFIELTERRNLFVHSDSKVSAQYLKVCGQAGANLSDCQIGSELLVSQPYFTAAYECVFEMGTKLAHVLWRKLAPEEREAADKNLNATCLDLLILGRNQLARTMLDFATGTLKKWSNDANRRMFILNRAQAYKWSNDEPKCATILNEHDWSAVDEKFILAVAILKEDFDGAVRSIKRLGTTGLPKASYREWPIFKRFRKTAEFQGAFRDVFGEEFSALPDELHNISFQLDFGNQAKISEKPPSIANGEL
jgi:hypothetical protein